MPKNLLRIITVASILTLPFLGATETAWGMWASKLHQMNDDDIELIRHQHTSEHFVSITNIYEVDVEGWPPHSPQQGTEILTKMLAHNTLHGNCPECVTLVESLLNVKTLTRKRAAIVQAPAKKSWFQYLTFQTPPEDVEIRPRIITDKGNLRFIGEHSKPGDD